MVNTVHRLAGCSETEVWEALWGLAADGLIYLDTAGQGSGTDNWRWCFSAVGRRAAEGGSWEPRDPDGFLTRLRRKIPDLDTLVELYMTEAVQSFRGRCYLATSVMLGVAAEHALLLMAQSYAASSLAGAAAMPTELDRPRSTHFDLWTEVRRHVEPARRDLLDGLADPLTLDAIVNLIRLTRNEAGHPTGQRIEEDTARVHLTIAPVYLRKMHQLGVHFDGLLAGAAT